MICSKIITKVILLCVVFGCLSYGRSVESKLKRLRRQAGDVKTAEYLARLALERRPGGCTRIGCGLIDIVASGKKRDGSSSSYGDQLNDEARAKLLTILLEGGATAKRR